ncbi:MAG: GNAT family N-acetyltransferase [Pseudomonadota bacterium]
MSDEPAFRDAVEADLPAILALLVDDVLGAARDRLTDPIDAAYAKAFAAIDANPHDRLIVAETEGAVVACAQLTILHGLSRRGATRGQIEGVRVASHLRGAGLGERLIRHCLAVAREKGCGLVQLTTDRSRTDAHRFYERLGFTPSHVGMKIVL